MFSQEIEINLKINKINKRGGGKHMKRLVKILPIIMTVLMVLTAISPVFAGAEALLGSVQPSPENSSATTFWEVGNNVLGIIQIVGTLIAVGVLMVIGIKYMMGSAEEKAEYKKTMLPYIIGAVVLFAAVNIAKAVVSVAGSITQTK